MPAEELSEVILNVIDGGKEISDTSKVIQFVADNGANIAQGTSNIVSSGNGIANDVTAITETVGGATATTGLGLLALDVGVAGAAIAPALGILAGVGLYNLAPEFWTNVSNKLVEAGQTIGGKVHALLTDDGKVAYSKETIEIFKNAFLESGIFDSNFVPPSPVDNNFRMHYKTLSGYETDVTINRNYFNHFITSDFKLAQLFLITGDGSGYLDKYEYTGNSEDLGKYLSIGKTYMFSCLNGANCYICTFTENPQKYGRVNSYITDIISGLLIRDTNFTIDPELVTIGDRSKLISPLPIKNWRTSDITENGTYFHNFDELPTITTNTAVYNEISWAMLAFILLGDLENDNLQTNATYPSSVTFPETYPDWQPITTPEYLPEYYPVELPTELPEQEQAQNPEEIVVTNPETWIEWITKNLPIPDPIANPQPEPVPEPDPDPQPEPDPLPEPDPTEEQKDPLNPNTDPSVPSTPLLPILPNTVSSNKLFTVYNPTLSQLNSLGAFLWSNDIIDALKKIWQDPLEGVISLRQVFCTPVVGNSSNIILGTLDSGVSSLVVTEQFVTQDCGTISLPEFFKNVSDYSPYTQLHLYLPFIGIVEINVNEFMNGTISITYHFDVYTGSVLIEVKCTRSSDMPSPTILYTFTGNASQALPITATNYQGAINATIGVATGALTLASGGGINPIFTMANMAHSVTHEMVHVNHASSLSGNAGIMGSRYPQLIVSRRKGYDANAYNDFYGYPTNKTVYLSNCSGYTRVKAIHFASAATQDEKNEIENLLKDGVIF